MIEDHRRGVVNRLLERWRIVTAAHDVLPDRSSGGAIMHKNLRVDGFQPSRVKARATDDGVGLLAVGYDPKPSHFGQAVGQLVTERIVDAVDKDRLDADKPARIRGGRSEEHTSELQSRGHLVCRLPHEKKK